MNRKNYLIVFLSLFALGNCTTSKIHSALLEPGYTQKAESIYYAVKFTRGIERTIPSFTDRTEEILSDQFPYEIEIVEADVFYEDDPGFLLIEERAKKHAYTHVLFLVDAYNDTVYKNAVQFDLTETITLGSPEKRIKYHGVEAFLVDLQTGNKVWQTFIEVKSGKYGNSKQTGNALAANIIKELMQSNLLPDNFHLSK